MDDDSENHNFLPDIPLEDIKQDSLNRREFAEKLAAQITGFKDPNCLVIGIHGPWGSGKSTFIKFLELEINDKRKDIIFVHFNPWNFSTIDQLIAMFFSEIQRSIGAKDKSADIKNLGDLLENFGSF